ncbi:uncharacterized protein LOC131685402 [Topomyia yanbarensis]|uniref:uncharacterized protein LOC131685402 n=1 Tax=Topomyia yanbarensis TaxID=2498891 RepID=UPI00273AEAFE|nr:uncharacterized protein LOC131685402 [Topomyia yanbarensis]
MKLHFDSKFCQYPTSHYAFVLNFLLWKHNFLAGICSRSLFYIHSNIFAAVYLIVNLALMSYNLLQLMQTSPDSVKYAENAWVLPLHVWKYDFTIRISGYYLQMAQLLLAVQSSARSLYYLLTSCYQSLLSTVVFVPLLFVMDVASLITNYRKECPGKRCRKYLLLQSLKLGLAMVFWTHICCFLHNEYARCIFTGR